MRFFVIGKNTFKEVIRDKILYNILFFAILMIGFSVLLGKLSLGEQLKMIKDMGLSCISLFGTLIAIFVGISLVFKEIDKRTIYTIIAKPISRKQFLIEKFLGLILVLLINVLIMSAGVLLIIYEISMTFEWNLLNAIFLIFIELMVITSIAILFSTFSTPLLSGIFTLAFFIIGHLSKDIKKLGEKSSDLVKFLTSAIYYVLPNLENFNIKGKVVHAQPVSIEFYTFSVAYGLLYIILIMTIAVLIFEKRDFK